ncbi:mitochondrial 37S ribosomal protein RSM25 [Spizellomyces punctatus DAOM BR117]|uniref:Small ribosomal subunit protein mS23 n=1 Tax=Spizellomyces punctatus (strain DAOM BR117) TaxID=645134 RepID=A0A0L0HUH3_SPIPD|nr:mitochondrial 37S ribosomal protein RSM25 [Spizellomyces punctatus DAOM BR117]KND05001.1 hypothetical protein SPPG_00682 [Spizellomyces punctatus DAOM BR117]|eukprot:XP_016613040.1 hypothetical protein SPPG_00682 [Spizellomyces punctatus DAOM BR117]
MAPPLRNNPYALLKNIDRLHAAGRIHSLPPWYDAVRRHPPATFIPKGATPTETGAFALDSHIQRGSARQNPLTYRPHYVSKPAVIVYPEDEIRAAFYRWHPLELARPISLVRGEEDLKERDWKDIYGGRPDLDVTGESVVQHTLYLMTHKNQSRHTAYQNALSAFYKARVEIEERERAAQQAAQKAALEELLADEEEDLDDKQRAVAEFWSTRPLTKQFVDWEMDELQKSQMWEGKIADAKQARRDLQLKMEQFEKRHLESDKTDLLA